MDYRYNKLSDHDLQVLLERHTALRYEAQLELMQELQERDIASVDLGGLEIELRKKKDFLNSLGFLKEMGYEVRTVEKTTTIQRQVKPQIIEILSIVVGVILVFVGMYGALTLYYLFTGDDGAGLQATLIHVFLVILGFKGFQMLGGLPRFINNWGMKFSFSEEEVRLEKRINFKKEVFTGDPKEVQIEQTEDTLLLNFKGETVLVANPKSFTQRETLKILLESINHGKVPQPYETANYAM